jgi:putative membrane protein
VSVAVAVNFGVIAVGAGGAVATGLIGWFGAQAIGHEVLSAIWAVPGALAVHSLQLFLSAVAWRCASGLSGPALPNLGAFFLVRWIRESVNSLLPVAQLGGNLVGIRLLMQRGVSGAAAGAGTTLDITVEALTQFVFTLTGIVTLALLDADRSWGGWLQGVAATMALGIGGFILAQRAGLLRIVEALARRLHGMFPALSVDKVRGLHDELMRLQRDRGALLRAGALHMLAWLAGVGETWLILRTMGIDIALPAATVIESLGMAARSAGFVVPGALGVQEAGFILVCDLFGIGPDAAIALSMLKRVRELLIGLPGLLAWQWGEGRRMLRRQHPTA